MCRQNKAHKIEKLTFESSCMYVSDYGYIDLFQDQLTLQTKESPLSLKAIRVRMKRILEFFFLYFFLGFILAFLARVSQFLHFAYCRLFFRHQTHARPFTRQKRGGLQTPARPHTQQLSEWPLTLRFVQSPFWLRACSWNRLAHRRWLLFQDNLSRRGIWYVLHHLGPRCFIFGGFSPHISGVRNVPV